MRLSSGIRRGRIVPREQLPAELAPISTPNRGSALPAARVALRPQVEAEAKARVLLQETQREAEQLLDSARAQAADVRLRAESEGRAEGVAKVAARMLQLTRAQAEADARGLDRSIDLARLLAERVLGAELQLHPERVRDLAKTALAEARGARRVVLRAHPDDVPVLTSLLTELGLGADSRVEAEDGRPRGQLRLETDLGVLDAELGPQLARLALRLRESLVS